MYPDMAKFQSNHRLYKSDIKPADHSNTNYKTTTLTWSKVMMKRQVGTREWADATPISF